jgi:hypothetical protein
MQQDTSICPKTEGLTASDPDFEKKNLRPESVIELYRLTDRHLSAKLVPTFAVRGGHRE